MTWFRQSRDGDAAEVIVHVQPNASKTRCAGLHGDAVKIQVAAVPADGRANACLCEFLADRLSLPMRNVTVKRGAASRRKTIEIHGLSSTLTAEALLAALQ